MVRRCIRSQILSRARFFQPLFADLVQMLEVKYSGKHRLPFSTRKIANEVATTKGTEPMKQGLAYFALQVTPFDRKPGMS
jgi:hypothetical protein